MTIITGKYAVTINKNCDGAFFALVSLAECGACVPGVPGKHFASYKTAVRGAQKMLQKAQA